MNMLREWLRRLWSLLRSRREDAEMRQEFRFHLDMETEKNLAAGMDAREARRQAHLRFGGMTPIQEAVRDARGVRPVSDMLRDIGLTVRSLRHSPLFTVVTVATLSLGIGATTAIFSFVDGILLSPLGYRQPDRLMTVQIAIPELADRFPVLAVNALSVDAWQRNCQVTCKELAAVQPVNVVVTGDGAPEPLRGARVSLGFFELLGIEPLLERVFEDADSEAPDARVAVLTHGLWQRRYGGDPAVLGRIIVLDDQAGRGRRRPAGLVLVPAVRRPDAGRERLVGPAGVLRAARLERVAAPLARRIRLPDASAPAAGRDCGPGDRRAERHSGWRVRRGSDPSEGVGATTGRPGGGRCTPAPLVPACRGRRGAAGGVCERVEPVRCPLARTAPRTGSSASLGRAAARRDASRGSREPARRLGRWPSGAS